VAALGGFAGGTTFEAAGEACLLAAELTTTPTDDGVAGPGATPPIAACLIIAITGEFLPCDMVPVEAGLPSAEEGASWF